MCHRQRVLINLQRGYGSLNVGHWHGHLCMSPCCAGVTFSLIACCCHDDNLAETLSFLICCRLVYVLHVSALVFEDAFKNNTELEVTWVSRGRFRGYHSGDVEATLHWDVTPSRLVNSYTRFLIACLHLQDSSLFDIPVD